MSGGKRPLDLLRSLAIQETSISPTFHHVEMYTAGGLLTLLWHGDRTEDRYVLMGAGAMGGLLGPADGLYHDLGVTLAEQGIGAVRVGYRQPNELEACVLDMAVAGDLASRAGGERFVTMGHSFGGAVAVGCGVALPSHVVGVVTLSTQSAGCEQAGRLAGKKLLLVHGDRDELLPVMCSEVVNELAGGHGEIVVLPGAGHLLNQGDTGEVLRRRLLEWIPGVLESPAG
ncbi:MAG TPA: alpha/beta hydrolase [Acidimicrobiales bacterium]|nr:alpha/beta hydrolase [Acidimicrobiales bacterium]